MWPVQLRLKAIKNIGKITKSMKMIASTKLNRAQKAMEIGQQFGRAAQGVLFHLKYHVPSGEGNVSGKDYVSSTEPETTLLKKISQQEGTEPKKTLLLACSSDRGLCGAIHSSVSKLARRLASLHPQSTSIVVLGDKAKPQIARDARRNIVMHFGQVGRNIPTFLDALAIWQTVRAQSDLSYDQVAIIYNRFVSVLNFETVLVHPPSLSQLMAAEQLTAYEYEPETLANLAEYLTVSRLFWALVEGHAAEMSSKRTAMENATKNADQIVLSLTMQYNRTRQAVITNELVDIITGASAI